VVVLGSWSGGLDNDADTLRLLRPGAPEPDGTVPYYCVDHVTYQTTAPWPEPGIAGGLEKVTLEAYGNDPLYWRPTLPGGSPGVRALNRPPIIQVIGDPVAAQESRLDLRLIVTDLDIPWQTVHLAAIELPPGSAFDSTLGTFSWTPSSAQGPGEFVARFRATDDSRCSAMQTDVEVPIDVIQALTLSATYDAGQLGLSFLGLSGETYRVEYRPDLATASWQVLREFTVSETQVVTVTDSAGGQSDTRFYRVVWLR